MQDSHPMHIRNRRFKAKNIQKNMVLYKSKKEIELDKLSKKLLITLLNGETNWKLCNKENSKKVWAEIKARKQNITQKSYSRIVSHGVVHAQRLNCSSKYSRRNAIKMFKLLKLNWLSMLPFIKPTSKEDVIYQDLTDVLWQKTDKFNHIAFWRLLVLAK